MKIKCRLLVPANLQAAEGTSCENVCHADEALAAASERGRLEAAKLDKVHLGGCQGACCDAFGQDSGAIAASQPAQVAAVTRWVRQRLVWSA